MDTTLGQIREGKFAPVMLDASSHASLGIDYPHHEVHDENYYRSGFSFPLANGQVATLSFDTPAIPECHLTITLLTIADGTFTLLEDVTSVSGGLALTALNHNRNSTNISGTVITAGYTGSNLITPVGGNTIMNVPLATAKGVTIQRGNAGEFVMKKDSLYLFKYTNGTNANHAQLILEWYEHTPKD